MTKFKTKYIPYFPIFGLGLYLITFLVATYYYPGGSENIPSDVTGYSFFHNFLCDTLHSKTYSGLINEGRPIAIIAHLLLSFTMISFFYILPNVFSVVNRNTKLIRVFGMFTMTVFILMYTEGQHDFIVILTGIFGSITFVPLFIQLHHFQNKGFKQVTYLFFILSILVFFSYETRFGFYYLPFFQKITFAVDSLLVVWTSIIVIKKNKSLAKL